MTAKSIFELDFGDLTAIGPSLPSDTMVLRTIAADPAWLTGVSPATAWVVEWVVESVDLPDRVATAIRDHVWTGYRLGRVAMALPDHPELHRTHMLDIIANAMYVLLMDVLDRNGATDLPDEVGTAVAHLAVVRACIEERSLPTPETPGTTTDIRVAVIALLLTIGLAIAVAEWGTHRVPALDGAVAPPQHPGSTSSPRPEGNNP